MKELHILMKSDSFIEDNKKYASYTTFYETNLYLNTEGVGYVYTTQPHFCSTTWLIKGWRIFVHMLDGEVVEITLGSNNKHTNRDIGIRHNLEKLLLANEFGKATEDYL